MKQRDRAEFIWRLIRVLVCLLKNTDPVLDIAHEIFERFLNFNIIIFDILFKLYNKRQIGEFSGVST